ncbi:MAG TPA: carboxypeptidase-like regulatory domain-containing protein, partial [Chitinophagaceae bacterium]|nr:carboxypeptidase-like regulatory domain-containing protein [Chitinophagaceae bacterium]
MIGENEEPLSNVSVVILGNQSGIMTNDTGYFRLKVPANKAFGLVFTYMGHREEQKNFLLNENEEEFISIRLERGNTTTLQEVIITDQRDRNEAGLIRPNPKSVINMPSVTTGVENLIKIFAGSNNE